MPLQSGDDVKGGESSGPCSDIEVAAARTGGEVCGPTCGNRTTTPGGRESPPAPGDESVLATSFAA